MLTLLCFECLLAAIVSGIEIGNECDIYTGNGHRNKSYDYVQYETEFAAYLAAYKKAGLPPKRIQGATFCCFVKSFDDGLKGYVQKYAADLATLSYHSYSGDHCGTHSVTASQLLSAEASSGRAEKYTFVVADTANEQVPFVIGEGNSVACGGQPGVSDTFASTLWVLDWLPSISKVGADSQVHRSQHSNESVSTLPISCIPLRSPHSLDCGLLLWLVRRTFTGDLAIVTVILRLCLIRTAGRLVCDHCTTACSCSQNWWQTTRTGSPHTPPTSRVAPSRTQQEIIMVESKFCW